jgi:hypothetical protein
VIGSPGQGPATAFAWAADGRSLVVGYGSGALRVVPATVDAALVRACATLRFFDRDADGQCARLFTDTSANHMRER